MLDALQRNQAAVEGLAKARRSTTAASFEKIAIAHRKMSEKGAEQVMLSKEPIRELARRHGASHDTIRLARLAIECGLFPIFEAEHGKVTHVRKIRQLVPVRDYLKPQRRFAHLFRDGKEDSRVARLQAICDANIAEFGLTAAGGDDV